MNRFVATLLLPALLLACSGGSNPFEDASAAGPGTGGGDEDNPVTAAGIPTSLANDLTRLNYNPASGTLTVEGITLDDVPFLAVYQRRPGLDRGPYQAFTAQNDALDRHNTAYVAQSNNDGSVRGGVVASGGPRNRFFAGGFYERDGGFTPPPVTPTTGLVSYSGSYVGLINIDDTTPDDLLALPGPTAPELTPTQAAEVTGNIFINADFADGSVEGNIFNRQIAESTGVGPAGTVLPSIVLISTAINADGTFLGDVEYDVTTTPGNNIVGTDIGDFGGIFGGPNASGVAGVVNLEEFDGPNDNFYGLESEIEYGVFVLDQCGQPVEDAAGCAGTNP